jgi:hypothetical protein
MNKANTLTSGYLDKVAVMLLLALCGLQLPVGVSSFAAQGIASLSRDSVRRAVISLNIGRSLLDEEAPLGINNGRSLQRPRSLIIEIPVVLPPVDAPAAPGVIAPARLQSNSPSSILDQSPPGVQASPKPVSPKRRGRPLISADESSDVPNYEAIEALREELELKTSEFNIERRAWQVERVRFIELIINVGRSLALRYEEIATLSRVVTEYSGREEELEDRIHSLNSGLGSEISDLERSRDSFEKLASENHFENGVDMNNVNYGFEKLASENHFECGVDVNNVNYGVAGQENQPNVFMWVQPNEPQDV